MKPSPNVFGSSGKGHKGHQHHNAQDGRGKQSALQTEAIGVKFGNNYSG